MITSTSNPKIKFSINLRKKKFREENKKFIIDGFDLITKAIKSQIKIETIFHSFCKPDELFFLKKLLKNDKIFIETSQQIFKKIAYGEIEKGFLAIASYREILTKNIILKKSPLIVIIEELEKPGNIGAILRSADAVNVDCVILCDSKTDLFNPNIIRASLGTCFSLNYFSLRFDEIKTFLANNNIQSISLTPNGTSSYLDINYKKGSAIIAGSEHFGLKNRWFENPFIKTFIPMNGSADSLNVSQAVTITLFEASRQRCIKI